MKNCCKNMITRASPTILFVFLVHKLVLSGTVSVRDSGIAYSFDTCVSSRAKALGGSRNRVCGGFSETPALTFGGQGTRSFTSEILPLTNGRVVISFYHRLGDSKTPYANCENVDAGEGVVLEKLYTNGTVGERLFSSNTNLSYFSELTRFVRVTLPTAMVPFRLRWRQLRHSGANFDEWMIDQVVISVLGKDPPLLACCGLSSSGQSCLWPDAVNASPLGIAYGFDTCTSPSSNTTNGQLSNSCGGFMGTKALKFSGAGTRSFSSELLPLTNESVMVSFYHQLGASKAPYASCEAVDAGEGVVLEKLYTNGTVAQRLFSSNTNIAYYESMRFVTVPLPPVAAPFRLRWRQLSHSCANCDQWMIDQVVISVPGKAPPLLACCGRNISLSCASIVQHGYADAFDTCITSSWARMGGKRSTKCGAIGRNALVFSNSGERSLSLGPVLLPAGGGAVFFYHVLGSGKRDGCEKVDVGEGVVLERRGLDNYTYHTVWSSDANRQYYMVNTKSPRFVSVALPSGYSWLRWRQLRHEWERV